MVMVLPMYEQEQPGVLYNTAAVVDADGSYLGKYRKHHIPHVNGLLGEVLLPARQPRLPGLRHRGRQGRRLHLLRPALPRGLAGARPERRADRVQPVGHQRAACRPTCGSSSSRRPRSPTSTSSARSTGSASRTSATTTSTARRYFVDPEGKFVGEVGRRAQAGAVVRDLDLRPAHRGPQPLGVLPRPPPRRVRRPGRRADDALLDHRRHRRRRRPAPSPTDVLVDGETIVGAARAGPTPLGSTWPRSPNASSTPPASTSSRAASTCHTHMELPFGGTVRLRHVRDRHPRRGLGRHHDDRRLRRAAHRRAGAGRAGRLARQGRRQLRDRLRLPPDRRRRRRRLAQGDGRAGRPRASPASSCSWPTRASSTATTGRSCGRCRRPRDNGADDHDARRERHRPSTCSSQQALARGETDPIYHGLTRPWQTEEEATHRAIMLADVDRRAALRRAHVGQAGRSDAVAAARDAGPERLRRDLPAVPLPVAGGAARRAGLRGRQVGLLDAAARASRGPPGRPVAGTCAPTTCPWSRTDHCPFCMKEQKELGHRRLLQDPQRDRLGRAPHGPDLPGRRRRADLRWSAGSSSARTTPARMFGLYPQQGRHRARAPTPTSWSTTRPGTPRIGVGRPTT